MASGHHTSSVVDRLGLASSLPGPSRATVARPAGPHETLPRLMQETELQKMLADEKMRSEQHKTHYQTLKVEHTRLQDEYVSLQNELKGTIEESKLVQEKYKAIMEQLRKDLVSKQSLVDELQSQAMNAQKLELLKLQVTEEVEKKYREKFVHADEEVDKYRNEYNRLKYEYSFLKSEYEHDKQEHSKIVEEVRMRHEAEVSNLRKERETLIARYQGEPGADASRARTLQRENAQLHLKVKGLLAELEEIRAQREHLGIQSDSVSRLQSKQLAEHAATVKALETERDSLKLQCANTQRELASTSELHTHLTGRIHDLEKDNIRLKNQAEEVSHKSRVELTNLKMTMLKERGDLERERDKLLGDIQDVQGQLEIAKHTAEQQGADLVEKEREAVRRVQAAREEEWQKLHKAESEKLELETKLQEMDRRKIDEESQRHAERERTEERVRLANEAKDAAEKEALVLRTKVQHHKSLIEQLDCERTENVDLKNRLHRIETQYNAYMNSEQEILENNSRLKQELEDMTDNLRKTKEHMRLCKDEAEKLVAQNKASWVEEKMNFQHRIGELEDQLTHITKKVEGVVETHRKKKKKFTQIVTKLKHKLTLLKAKNEELQIQKEALEKSVPTDTHLQLKKQFRDMLRRHREFRAIMLTSSSNAPAGDITFASVNPDASIPGWSFLEHQHQKDLALLKDRVDMLDDNQRQQLEKLQGVSPIVSPRHQVPPLVIPDDNIDSDKENITE